MNKHQFEQVIGRFWSVLLLLDLHHVDDKWSRVDWEVYRASMLLEWRDDE